MDKNKLKVLQEIGYEIKPVCGLCTHGVFVKNGDFGGCAIKAYDHLKHSAADKPLSINCYGSCPEFKYDDKNDVSLHGFREFLK